jgi:predicted aldo/keto reductase-like oxidoreductase
MLYRKLGKCDAKVSVLGFGCMRLPMIQSKGAADIFDPNTPIDEEKASEMIHYAIEQGINYFDTAYPYHGGKSETFLGKTIKGQRDKNMLATKLPTWLVRRADDFEKFLNEQLQKLDTDFLDVYLLHGLDRAGWNKIKDLGVLGFFDKIRADGRAKYLGFSFHDDVRIFKEITDAYDWDLCQIQYNYFDENFQAGREGLEYAASKGLGIVIMEPLRGGKLTEGIPLEVQTIWDSATQKRTAAEWALKWVWNHPQVSMALSGMTTMAQLVENIRIADEATPDSLSAEELALIEQVTQSYRKMLKVGCTSCGYCMPCPAGIHIPMNFSLYNDTFMFKDPEISVMLYNQFLAPEHRASNCAECGECEERCPQHINIMDELKNVHARLAR